MHKRLHDGLGLRAEHDNTPALYVRRDHLVERTSLSLCKDDPPKNGINKMGTFPQNKNPEKEKLRSEREEKAAKLKLLRTKLKQVQRNLRRKLTTESETKKRKKTEDDCPSRKQSQAEIRNFNE